MALTSGFYASLNHDRVYTADQVNNFFEGLVSPNGIYESVDNAFIVKASSGLTLTVGSGRGLVDQQWVRNDADITITLNAPNVALPRYTAIVLRNNVANRQVTLEMIDGTAASTPAKPDIVRNNEYFDILLAYVYVAAAATTITQADITDTRADTNVCGWITGLITQVDTSELFLQWQDAYQSYYDTVKEQLDDFMETLTEELNVNTYLVQYTKYVELEQGDSRIIPLDMKEYTYSATDIIDVYLNGLMGVPVEDFLIDDSKTPPEVHVNLTSSQLTTNEVYIRVFKSKIAIPVQVVDANSNAIITSDNSNLTALP